MQSAERTSGIVGSSAWPRGPQGAPGPPRRAAATRAWAPHHDACQGAVIHRAVSRAAPLILRLPGGAPRRTVAVAVAPRAQHPRLRAAGRARDQPEPSRARPAPRAAHVPHTPHAPGQLPTPRGPTPTTSAHVSHSPRRLLTARSPPPHRPIGNQRPRTRAGNRPPASTPAGAAPPLCSFAPRGKGDLRGSHHEPTVPGRGLRPPGPPLHMPPGGPSRPGHTCHGPPLHPTRQEGEAGTLRAGMTLATHTPAVPRSKKESLSRSFFFSFFALFLATNHHMTFGPSRQRSSKTGGPQL